MSIDKIKNLEIELQKEITARKKAEKILAFKKAEIKAINDNLTTLLSEKNFEFKGIEEIIDPYILMDLFGNVLKMNTAAIDFFGYNNQKETFSVFDLIYKEEYEYAMSSFYELQEKGIFKNYKARIVTKSKEIKWVQINSNIIFDDHKTPLFAQGIIREITQEKNDAELILAQKKQLDAIIDNSSLGIVLTKGPKIIRTNSAFQKLLNYSKEEISKKKIFEISHPNDNEPAAPLLKKLNNGEIDHFSLKKRYLTKEGNAIWSKTNVANVDAEGKDDSEKILVGIVDDITEDLKQEKLLKTLLSDLTKSNKDLKDFAHVVSHDLKTPLSSMNTLVTWLQEDSEELTFENKKTLSSLLKQIDKMDLLINGILNYTSIDKTEYRVKNVNLNHLINDVLDVFLIPNHISIKIKTELPTIKGDIHKFKQLFQNFISNALRYNDKKQGQITINCISKSNFWEFSIEDNGIGISKKYFKKIFEVFQSLEETEGSSGLGLSIIAKIVSYYNGKLWLESEINKGTTFYFTLPKK